MALPTRPPGGGGSTQEDDTNDTQEQDQEQAQEEASQDQGPVRESQPQQDQERQNPANNRAIAELRGSEQTTSPNKNSDTPPPEFRNTSNPSPARGGPARSPTTNQESQENEESKQSETPISQEQPNTPISGGIAGPPGSGTTVEPETAGQLDAVKERVAEQSDDLDKDDLRVTGDRRGRVGLELTEDAKEERRQRFLEKNRGKIRAVGEIYSLEKQLRTRQNPAGAPGQQDLEAKVKALDNKRDIEKAERKAETESFTLNIGGKDLFTLEGRVRDVEPVRNEDGSITFEQQERLDDDIDWSQWNDQATDFLGVNVPLGGDPAVDEVEQFYKDVQASAFEAADLTGKLVAGGNIDRGAQGPEGQLVSDLDEGELAPEGTLDESEIADEPLEVGKYQRGAQGVVTGIASAPAIAASLPVTLMEGTELGVKGVEKAGSGDLDEFTEDVESAAAGSAAAAGNAAAENPYRTGGMLAGSLVGTGGVFRAASKVGPKTSAATRGVLQPGEEALGIGGFHATRAVGNRLPNIEGEAAAQRLFPNKEPLLFSEEAAIRASKRAGAAARRGTSAAARRGRVEATSARFRLSELFSDDVDFRTGTRGSDRGQASLIPRGRQKPLEVETETDVGADAQVETESERLRADAESSDVTVDNELETGGRLFETTGVLDAESTDLLSEAQTPQADTNAEGLPGSELEWETDFGQEFETDIETELETEQEIETEQRQELELEFEVETEQETETELEFETEVELESETETEALQLDPVQTDSKRKQPSEEEFSKVFENPFISPEELAGGKLDEDLRGLD